MLNDNVCYMDFIWRYDIFRIYDSPEQAALAYTIREEIVSLVAGDGRRVKFSIKRFSALKKGI